MRKILFLFLFSNIIFASSDMDRLFNEANVYYQKNDYEKAAQAYQQILKNGYENEDVYFNLGNAYFRMGKLGYAILNYEKAAKFSPGDDDIEYNLAIANARTIDKIDTLPRLFLIDWWEALLNIFSINGWAYFSLITFIFVLCVIILYFIARTVTIQRWSFFSGVFLTAVFALSILFLVVRIQNESATKYGVIVEQSSTAKLSPDNQSGDAFLIHEGLKVNLQDEVNNWVKIKLADGKVGWVPEGDLKVI